jgi:hypothetical protein
MPSVCCGSAARDVLEVGSARRCDVAALYPLGRPRASPNRRFFAASCTDRAWTALAQVKAHIYRGPVTRTELRASFGVLKEKAE